MLKGWVHGREWMVAWGTPSKSHHMLVEAVVQVQLHLTNIYMGNEKMERARGRVILSSSN